MEEITRIPEDVSGVKDGVQLEANCVHTLFHDDEFRQTQTACTIMASWENGVLSINFTVDGKRQALGIRLDETLMLLQEANNARIEAEKGIPVEKR